VVSFILPVLQIGALRHPVDNRPTFTMATYAVSSVHIPPTMAQPITLITPISKSIAPIKKVINKPVKSPLTLQNELWYAYVAGTLILLFILITKLFSLYKLIHHKHYIRQGKHKIVYLSDTNIAFSFFNYLFIGADTNGANIIITHELVHIRQKHSADIIFLELLKIINWFNPLIYLLQNSLKSVHEYIADEQTATQETDAISYSSFLVNNAYGAAVSSITNSFFTYTLLKKRIIMLNQQRSGNLARLKYLIALPIFFGMLCISTLALSKSYGWVDLAPAKAIKSSVKKKLLKISQNGITTITDQLSVNQEGKNVIFSANTINPKDRSLLLKNHKIKVEVVNDTLQHERLILPVVNADGYHLLDYYLHKSIHYRPASGDKGGLVEVGFSLDKDRRIIDAKIVKSGGSKLDALALNAFKAYKGIVNDDSGKNYKLGVYFFTDDYSIFKTDSLGNDPEFAGEVIIPNYNYVYKTTSKDYEYEETGGAIAGYQAVTIYEKNGESKYYPKNGSTPAELQLLKDKYGYRFPSSVLPVIQAIHPANVNNKRLAYIFELESYLQAPYADQFINYANENIKYPEEAKNDLTGGVVVLNFSLDDKGLISNIGVVQKAGHGFDEAAVNVLQNYKNPINDKAGQHSIAIVFCVAEKQYRPSVSDHINKDGYVGELAVSDIKPAIINRKFTLIAPKQ
jgi:TonB family protein